MVIFRVKGALARLASRLGATVLVMSWICLNAGKSSDALHGLTNGLHIGLVKDVKGVARDNQLGKAC